MLPNTFVELDLKQAWLITFNSQLTNIGAKVQRTYQRALKRYFSSLKRAHARTSKNEQPLCPDLNDLKQEHFKLTQIALSLFEQQL